MRFYCQGIGDCHLLSFPKPGGGAFRMLIDCGVHPSITGGGTYIGHVIDDLVEATAPDHFIDVVVLTHEHMDHNSGFLSAKFAQLKFGQAWLAWTEDPSDAQARRLDKFKGEAIAALQDAGTRLKRIAASAQESYLATLAQGVENLSAFHFGAAGERVRSARDAVVALADGKVRYLEPADAPIALLPNLRVYVLGPPRDEDMLGIRERASEMYGIAGNGWPLAQALRSALSADLDEPESGGFLAPFEPNLGANFAQVLDAAAQPPGAEPADLKDAVIFAREHYTREAWRRIDNDWLAMSADLALQLDDRTNNTSLVLAFEFVDTGRVLLFAADAQVGNWLSWQDAKWTLTGSDGKSVTVTGPDLLARTVLYKVGHHGSQNATLKAKGLEQMVSKDLAAFVPTNKKDALKVKWGAMPFDDILQDLTARTQGRVIRADDPWLKDPDASPPFPTPSGAVKAVRHMPGDAAFTQGLYVELDIA